MPACPPACPLIEVRDKKKRVRGAFYLIPR